MNSRNSSPKPGRPVAPAPYRPQPVPKVLQRKVAPPATKPIVAPVAPPVYRPQPAPVVLQRKVRPELQSRAVPAQQTNPLAPKTVTAQPRKPASAPVLNQPRVAQQKTNNQMVHRPRVMSIPRGIHFRGTVQRASEAVAPAVRWYFQDVPDPVQRTLKAMVIQVPLFKTLCESVMAQFAIINVATMEAVKGRPRAHYKNGVVYINEDMDHDDMVNSVVFELTNAMHSQSLSHAQSLSDVSARAESIEYNEYHGVMIQSEIIKAAKGAALVDKEMFGHLVGKGKRWETFAQYAKDQQASGHTGLYEKGAKKDPPPDNGSKCFITSACVFARGLSDDCDELTTLRTFRDDYILNLPGGPELVQEYYEVAPGIVDRIYESEDSASMLGSLYDELVVPSVTLILNGEYQQALFHYRTWVARLTYEFCS